MILIMKDSCFELLVKVKYIDSWFIVVHRLREDFKKKPAYFMTFGKLGFWPTYPTLVETKKIMTIWLMPLTYPPYRYLDKFQKIFG